MDFYALLDQVVALLRQRQRVTYRALKRHFQLDDAVLEDLTVELIKGQRLAVDEDEAADEMTTGPADGGAADATAAKRPARSRRRRQRPGLRDRLRDAIS